LGERDKKVNGELEREITRWGKWMAREINEATKIGEIKSDR
jgi:hypothetical protein